MTSSIAAAHGARTLIFKTQEYPTTPVHGTKNFKQNRTQPKFAHRALNYKN
jgi:hypothetical protein